MTRQQWLELIATIMFILNLLLVLLQTIQNALQTQNLILVGSGTVLKVVAHGTRKTAPNQN